MIIELQNKKGTKMKKLFLLSLTFISLSAMWTEDSVIGVVNTESNDEEAASKLLELSKKFEASEEEIRHSKRANFQMEHLISRKAAQKNGFTKRVGMASEKINNFPCGFRAITYAIMYHPTFSENDKKAALLALAKKSKNKLDGELAKDGDWADGNTRVAEEKPKGWFFWLVGR
jgi:hypothetical protein